MRPMPGDCNCAMNEDRVNSAAGAGMPDLGSSAWTERRGRLADLVRTRFPGMNPEDIEDVVQEAVLCHLNKVESGTPIRNVDGYLAEICLHKAADIWRVRV